MHTGLLQMGGSAVAQGVEGGALMATARCEGRPQGVLDPVAGHGGGGRGHAEIATAWSGENPGGMAVRFPVLAQELQGAWG